MKKAANEAAYRVIRFIQAEETYAALLLLRANRLPGIQKPPL